MMNSQKPIMRRMGAQEYSSVAQGLGGDLDVAIGELVAEALVLRRRVGAELVVAVAAHGGREHTGNLVPGDRDGLHLVLLHVLEKRRERHRVLGTLEGVRELPDHDPDDDQDHPEQQALEGRIQPEPPKTA
jgi:hypothetical protein